MSSTTRRSWSALAVLAALAAAGCSDGSLSGPPTDSPTSSSHTGEKPTSASTTPTTGGDTTGSATAGADGDRTHRPRPVRRVLAISIDGLAPQTLGALGPEGAPAIWSMLDTGVGTLNARTDVDFTVTLPNHVGMVTGRPVEVADGGHGVEFNRDRPGARVPPGPDGVPRSIFTSVHAGGGTSVVFSGKTKFDIFANTWPDGVNEITIDPDQAELTDAAVDTLAHQRPTLTFVHLADPDKVGHRVGWESPAYRDAVRRADDAVARLLEVVRTDRRLRAGTAVVLTSDHGGHGHNHTDARDARDYTIPFAVVGPGIPAGDLYELSPGLVDPGASRPSFGDGPPIRNCDLANVAASWLRLEPVPGSSCVAATMMPLTGRTGH